MNFRYYAPNYLPVPFGSNQQGGQSCTSNNVKQGFKTKIPRDLRTIPRLPVKEIMSAYFDDHPNDHCLTSARLWIFRQLMTPINFEMWYRRAIKQSSILLKTADEDLKSFENWFKSAPRPDDSEVMFEPNSSKGTVSSNLQSGWLVDISGLNPQRGEYYYTKLFDAQNSFEFVKKYKNQPSQATKLLQSSNGEDSSKVKQYLISTKMLLS
jgi:hypothetical protein